MQRAAQSRSKSEPFEACRRSEPRLISGSEAPTSKITQLGRRAGTLLAPRSVVASTGEDAVRNSWRGTHEDPRDLRLLPRQRGLPRRRGGARGGGARGALHAQEARRALPDRGRRVLPSGGRPRCLRARPRGLLRQAAAQARPPDRDLARLRALRVQAVPPRAPHLAPPEDARPPRARPRPRWRLPGSLRLHLTPRIPRRERVLSLALRGGRDPHARRGR